jgi:hypothetical protein
LLLGLLVILLVSWIVECPLFDHHCGPHAEVFRALNREHPSSPI